MTNIQYKVDDMTCAPMDVKQWVDTEVSRVLWNLTQTTIISLECCNFGIFCCYS